MANDKAQKLNILYSELMRSTQKRADAIQVQESADVVIEALRERISMLESDSEDPP